MSYAPLSVLQGSRLASGRDAAKQGSKPNAILDEGGGGKGADGAHTNQIEAAKQRT